MLGAFLAIRRDPLTYLRDVWREHGDVVQFPIPRPPSYLICDPDAVRQVLVDRSRDFTKETLQYRALALVTGQGLLTSSDARDQRRVMQPAFHPSRIPDLLGHAEQATSTLVRAWQGMPAGSVVDVEMAMAGLALETVGHSLFGDDLSGDAELLVHASLEGLDAVIARARMPVSPPAWIPTPRNRQLASANRQLDAAARGLIRQRQEMDASSTSPDALDVLLRTREDSAPGLSDEQIRDEIVTMLIAGHETVASSLVWALALLAAHPEIQERVHHQSALILGDAALSVDQLAQLPFVRATVDESMRLYPSAWLISRKSQVAGELGGAHVPSGSLVIISPYLIHRHPGFWPDPERFDPGRFVDAEIPRVAFIPFGAGPRLCIGRDFAYAEAVTVLARLCANFTFSYAEGSQLPSFDPGVTLRPRGGLRLRIAART